MRELYTAAQLALFYPARLWNLAHDRPPAGNARKLAACGLPALTPHTSLQKSQAARGEHPTNSTAHIQAAVSSPSRTLPTMASALSPARLTMTTTTPQVETLPMVTPLPPAYPPGSCAASRLSRPAPRVWAGDVPSSQHLPKEPGVEEGDE